MTCRRIGQNIYENVGLAQRTLTIIGAYAKNGRVRTIS